MQVGVLGAGAIGCALGGRLKLGGAGVVLVGRPWLKDRVGDGLRLSRFGGPEQVVRGLRIETDPAALAGCDVVFVTTKSRDTAAAAGTIPADVKVVASLQNGVRNTQAIRDALPPGRTVWPGMVPFNVIWTDDGRLHQGTSGPVVLPLDGADVVRALWAGGCEARTHGDVPAVQWGKLLLNLNNAVNALSGLTLREQLSDAGWRRVLADVIDEGRTVLKRARVRVRGVGRLRPGLAPTVLRLPDAVFFRVAGAMIQIDPEARSSMQDDLVRGRPTEVDELNGEIVQLGAAPLNGRLISLVRAAEGKGSPRLSPADVRGAI